MAENQLDRMDNCKIATASAAGLHTADYCSTAAPAATGGGFIEFLEP